MTQAATGRFHRPHCARAPCRKGGSVPRTARHRAVAAVLDL